MWVPMQMRNLNIYCNMHNLVIFMLKIRGIQNPKVSLLNIGTEPAKGNTLTKKSYQLLKDDQSFNFDGNIETKTLTDVVVTDGYTGNMVLKNIEGTAKSIGKMLKETFLGSLKTN